jgi:hypothetical protein
MEEVAAREAIRATMALYVRNADSADYERHIEVFHPDAEMIIHAGKSLRGLEEIKAALKQGAVTRGAFDPGNFQRHHLTTCLIELNGDGTARATTYIIVFTELGLDHTGSYTDVFEKYGDRWLLKRRQATLEWARPDSRFVRWLGKPNSETTHAPST